MEYDGSWALRVPQKGAGRGVEDWPRPLLSNGKLVLRPSMGAEVALRNTRLARDAPRVRTLDGIDDAAAVGSVLVPDGRGGEREGEPSLGPGNTMDVFDFGDVRFFDQDPRAVEHRLHTGELRMDTGTFTAAYQVWRDGVQSATVSHDVYPCRQHRHAAVQSFRVRVDEQAVAGAQFFHDLSISKTVTEREPTYVTEVLSVGTHRIHVFSADASLKDGTHVSAASSYVWDEKDGEGDDAGLSSLLDIMGNTEPVDPGRATHVSRNRVRLHGGEPLEGGGREFRFHIVSCVMTGHDAADPRADCRRLLLHIVARPQVMTALRVEHVRRWDALWSTDVHIVPKVGITPAEKAAITALKRDLRYALYTLYSCVRCARTIQPSTGPLSLDGSSNGVVDLSGHAVAQGDLWLVPCLTLVCPSAARALLDARRVELRQAAYLAELRGFRGAEFSYADPDPAARADAPYGALDALRVFPTALVGLNCWNYYRLTQDAAWLRAHGFPVLRHAADFVASAFERRPDGAYALLESVGLDGRKSTHDTFAVNAALLTLRAAIQASYVVGVKASSLWMLVLARVRTLYLESPEEGPAELKYVYRMDASDDGTPPGTGADPLPLVPPLFIVTPLQSEIAHPNGRFLEQALTNNLRYYEDRVVSPLEADILEADGVHQPREPGPVSQWHRRSLFVASYSSAEVSAMVGGRGAAEFVSLEVEVADQPAHNPYPAYAIGMKQDANPTVADNSGGGFTAVFRPKPVRINRGVLSLAFDVPFRWTQGNNLHVSWARGAIGDYSETGRVPTSASGKSYYAWSDEAGTYSINDATTAEGLGTEGGGEVDYRPVFRLVTGQRALPMNLGLLAYLRGLAAQIPAPTSAEARAGVSAFVRGVGDLLATAKEPRWGNLRNPLLSPSSALRATDAEAVRDGSSDLNASAMLLVLFLSVTADTSIVGGITSTRFQYEEMRLRTAGARGRNMPPTWKAVRATGLGEPRRDVTVTNNVPYA